jgi:hypothetical protein
LFIGVIDLFAVLVPGLIAVALILVIGGRMPDATVFSVSGFLIAGWVMGHVLHGIGSVLDDVVYDRLFRPRDVEKPNSDGRQPQAPGVRGPSWIRRFRTPLHSLHEWLKEGLYWFRELGYFHKNDMLHRRAMDLAEVPGGLPVRMYQWARAWLNTHRPESMPGLERIEADQKLFRSLAVLSLVVAILPLTVRCYSVCSYAFPGIAIRWVAFPEYTNLYGSTSEARLLFAGCAFLAFLFSLWRYCDLRTKAIRHCYLNYVQLRLEEAERAKPDHDKILASERH